MIFALIHPSFIGGNQDHRALDTRGTGDHVPDKALMAGNIDYPYDLFADHQVRKS